MPSVSDDLHLTILHALCPNLQVAFCALAALLAHTIPSFQVPLQQMGALEGVQAALQASSIKSSLFVHAQMYHIHVVMQTRTNALCEGVWQVHGDQTLQIHGALALRFLRSPKDDSSEWLEDM